MSVRQMIDSIGDGFRHVLSPQRKALRALRARWGKPATGDGWYAREYFDRVRERAPTPIVDDKTWADLELPALFQRLDATVTPVGSQVLWHMLHCPSTDAATLAARYAGYARLRADPALREALQRPLLALAGDAGARVADFIFGDIPPLPRYAAWISAWAAVGVLTLAGVIAGLVPLPVWLLVLLVNVVVLLKSARWNGRDAPTLPACLRLAAVADALAALHARHPAVPELAELAAEQANRAAVRRAMRATAFIDRLHAAPLDPVPLLSFAFLVELVVRVRATRRFERVRQKLERSFELVGRIDAMLAIASWLEACPDHCAPAFTERALLDIRDGRHPLLGLDAVRNSIRLDGRSALVTGSNMAGKTTFIKMLALNALLGQTLGFCVARAATLPRMPVRASIRNEHSVVSGKSHYFAEVETIRGFLSAQAAGRPAILAIDELFNGTNTVERIAIARAVLEALGEGSIVLATTHDVELQALLGRHYDLYHFQEDPAVDGYFDYRLRPGAATERNAIRLLAEQQYPPEVIEHALAYAAAATDGAATGDAGAQPLDLQLSSE